MPLSQRAPLGSHSTALGDHICTKSEKETKFRDFLLLPNAKFSILTPRIRDSYSSSCCVTKKSKVNTLSTANTLSNS